MDAEVVSGSGGKSATAAKTEELIDSAKDVYSQVTVRTDAPAVWELELLTSPPVLYICM